MVTGQLRAATRPFWLPRRPPIDQLLRMLPLELLDPLQQPIQVIPTRLQERAAACPDLVDQRIALVFSGLHHDSSSAHSISGVTI